MQRISRRRDGKKIIQQLFVRIQWLEEKKSTDEWNPFEEDQGIPIFTVLCCWYSYFMMKYMSELDSTTGADNVINILNSVANYLEFEEAWAQDCLFGYLIDIE